MVTFLSRPPATRHSLVEDIAGILTGTMLMALAVQFLRGADLITGQIAGLSLVLSYLQNWSFGVVFFALSLPFFVLAVLRMGWRFSIKTFVSIGLVSVFADALPIVFTLDSLHPIAGAVFGGILSATGLIVLFRHGATLGGIGVVAIWLQETRNIPAGNTQLAFDLVLFAVAFFLYDPVKVAISLLSAVIVNLMITVNHRGDRYIARS